MISNSYNVPSTSPAPHNKIIETLRQRGHLKCTKVETIKSGTIDLRDLYITPEIMECISLFRDTIGVNSLEVRFHNCILENTTMNLYTCLDLELVFTSSYVKNLNLTLITTMNSNYISSIFTSVYAVNSGVRIYLDKRILIQPSSSQSIWNTNMLLDYGYLSSTAGMNPLKAYEVATHLAQLIGQDSLYANRINPTASPLLNLPTDLEAWTPETTPTLLEEYNTSSTTYKGSVNLTISKSTFERHRDIMQLKGTIVGGFLVNNIFISDVLHVETDDYQKRGAHVITPYVSLNLFNITKSKLQLLNNIVGVTLEDTEGANSSSLLTQNKKTTILFRKALEETNAEAEISDLRTVIDSMLDREKSTIHVYSTIELFRGTLGIADKETIAEAYTSIAEYFRFKNISYYLPSQY